MGQQIEVDDEVFDLLKREAEPFVDTPNSVLRRLLGLEHQADLGEERRGRSNSEEEKSGTTARAQSGPTSKTLASDARVSRKTAAGRRRSRGKSSPGKRAPVGSLLPEQEYELPLLAALHESGGSGPKSDIVDRTGEKLDGKLTELDRQPLSSGQIRWKSRVQFVRIRLIERGLMAKNTPTGVWAITDVGRGFLAEHGYGDIPSTTEDQGE